MATPSRTPTHGLATRFASLAALFLGGACGTDAPPAPAPEVLSRGEEPRQSIELDAVPLDPCAFDLAVEMAVGLMHGQNAEKDRHIAPIHVALQLRADPAISGRGNFGELIVGETTITEAGADPEVVKNWNDDLKRMTPRGIKARLEADSRGRMTKVDLRIPSPAPNTVRQLLQSVKSVFELFAVPRCDEPVGVGAQLRDQRKVSLSGMNLDLDATYTLRSIEADRLVFDTEMKLRALPQLIDLPSSKDPASKAELLSAGGIGVGRIVVPRHRIGPLEGKLSLPLTMEVRLQFEGKETVVKSRIDLGLTLTAR